MINDDIVDFLSRSSSPMMLESIADALFVPQERAKRALDELTFGKKVVVYSPDNKINGRKYYTVPTKKIDFEDKKTVNESEKDSVQDSANGVVRAVVQETINVRDDYKDLSEKIETIDKNVNGIYANIISIMSIFVGIFALITVNANIAFELTQENMCEVFCGIIVMNIFVVICIITLLIGIRVILINPMLEKKKSNSKTKRG